MPQIRGMRRREQFPGKTKEERESCIPAFGREDVRGNVPVKGER